ncbi:hypothetical protein QTP86_010906 [Hemibagrus guttatus]|nr:hypothetical protein QTP86_010906 [Hemibagrus guttatus]
MIMNVMYKRHLSTTSNSQTPNSTMAKTKELYTRNKIVDLHQAGKTESAIVVVMVVVEVVVVVVVVVMVVVVVVTVMMLVLVVLVVVIIVMVVVIVVVVIVGVVVMVLVLVVVVVVVVVVLVVVLVVEEVVVMVVVVVVIVTVVLVVMIMVLLVVVVVSGYCCGCGSGGISCGGSGYCYGGGCCGGCASAGCGGGSDGGGGSVVVLVVVAVAVVMVLVLVVVVLIVVVMVVVVVVMVVVVIVVIVVVVVVKVVVVMVLVLVVVVIVVVVAVIVMVVVVAVIMVLVVVMVVSVVMVVVIVFVLVVVVVDGEIKFEQQMGQTTRASFHFPWLKRSKRKKDMKEVERHSSSAAAQEVAEEVHEFTLAQFSLFGSLNTLNFIPDRSRPGLTMTAIGAVDLQGAGGNWATVGRRSRGGRRVHRQREKRKGKNVGLRIGTLNVGTMTGKGRELADVMERRKVDILCVQETRWKGSKARSIGAGFKLFYYGVDSKRNGVGVVLKEEFVRNVLEVKRVSDRVMSLKLEIEGVMLNVVSGYAPQVGCELEEKERFWSELDEVMESIPTGERVVIGADFNGHVGEGNTGDEEVMGKFGVKERNLEGQMVVDFAKRMDMAVVNTYFQKREEHRVTYKSGDLEKAYDRVPREELWYCMRKSGVAEKYVRVVQDMYERSRTVVRCAVGQTEEFNVQVGLHQGSALSPFLFAIVMDQLSEEVRQESPWTMMFADDIVICSESREQVEENLERWRFALERRGMKVSRSKTEYMCVNGREGSGTVRLQGEEVKKVQEFKYLGSTVQSNGECGKEVKKRVQAGWNGWRKVSGVLCDRKISSRIKGKVYRTVVRPAMLYGLETVSLRKRQESELEVAELKMLRFSLGVTRLDRIRNEYIRGTAHVGRLGDKVREARLRWFGHVQRRESEYIGRRMLDMELPGRRQRGRPKRSANLHLSRFSSTCSLLSLQITMSSANIIVQGDSCLTSSDNWSITIANGKRGSESIPDAVPPPL